MESLKLKTKLTGVLMVLTCLTSFSKPLPDGPLINEDELKKNMEMLSVGLSGVADDLKLREAYYTALNHCVDNYYFVYYDDLLTTMKEAGYDLKPQMNAAIMDYYRFNEEGDYITQVFDWCRANYNVRPQIVVPHYTRFQMDEHILEMNPQVGWYTFESEWPLHCVNCAEERIYKDQAHSSITWFVTPMPAPIYYINGNPFVWITNCMARNWYVSEGISNCQVCPPAAVPVTQNTLGTCGTLNHELKIFVQELDDNLSVAQTNCLFVQPAPFPVNGVADGNYAILSKMDTYDYYKIINDNNSISRVVKVAHPLVDYEHTITGANTYNPLFGDVLTICEPGTGTEFEALSTNTYQPGNPQFRYSNAYGGIYHLYRPGIIGMKHLYFSYPWASGMWFSGSPDLTIKLDIKEDLSNGGNCPPNNIRLDKQEVFDLCGNLFYSCANTVFGPTLGNVMDYLVTTDFNTINTYWHDNAVTVGLKSGSGYVTGNVYEFIAGNNPNPGCTIPGNAVQIQQFILNSASEYEISKLIKLNGSSVPVGTTLYINVQAKFTNGEYINENKCITVNNNAINTGIIQFRGNVKDYDASVVNYLVTVYH